MSDTTLRRTDRDLFEAAREVRETDIPRLQAKRDDLEQRAREEYDDPEGVPGDLEREYQQYGQQLRELHGTADTYEHYAEAWSGDGETCVFVLEELNGDEYARTIDAVSAEARRQAREDGDLPDGYGQVKALEFGVVDLPAECPPEPGQWPAAIVGELFSQLNDITAPAGVDLGNESLADVVRGESDGDGPPATRHLQASQGAE